ncbi:sodium-dependent nutrient amino acid transporter 1 isoform X4 [Nilaparvata lugens]|uniref:sodium-dependent nutrient amino acid transporter 1 isoform X4 n=1 Tax=Nilaparvata lugens TaxID=108931 RepID=UPI00193DB98A|nr:sodium-dependent nutrient amino acid transporter 1 isoform X4 [Nilaparvata lugens]
MQLYFFTIRQLKDQQNFLEVPWCHCLPSLGTVMVILSVTASLGNIVRLPTVVFHNGGGTFLVVYTILAIVIGIPLVFLEVVLGQFCQEGTTKLWRAVPLLKGVGLVKVLTSFLIAIYYPVIMAMSLFYAIWTGKGPVPFTECDYLPPRGSPPQMDGEICLQETFLKPPDQDPVWFGVDIALLFMLWALIVLCVSRGTRSYKVCAFFTFIPTVVGVIALLSQELTISSQGINELLLFDWKYLFTFDTWYYALIQLFFSTHIGFGNITTCAGRLYSKSNAFWTAVLYMLCNLAVGISFVCIIYLWIGRLETNGIKLVWPQIPELFVITLLYDVTTHVFGETAQIWAIISFLVIIFAGLNSMVVVVFTVVESIMIETKDRWRSWMITAGVCAVGFLAGIICLLPVRMELVHMLDHYVIGHMVAASTALELIGFAWIYGSFALYSDFEFVLGQKLNPIWSAVWFLTPIVLVIFEIWSLVTLPVSSQHDAQWLQVMGWVFYAASWCIVIVVALWQVFTQVDYNIAQKLLSTLKPSRNWGPVDPIYRHGWVVWRGQSSVGGERDFTLKRRGTRDYTHSVKRAHSNPKGASRYHAPSSAGSSPGALHTLSTRSTKGDHPPFNDLHTTSRSAKGDHPPFVVQLPPNDLDEHVCWRKDTRHVNGKT